MGMVLGGTGSCGGKFSAHFASSKERLWSS